VTGDNDVMKSSIIRTGHRKLLVFCSIKQDGNSMLQKLER